MSKEDQKSLGPHYKGWEVGEFIHRRGYNFFEGSVLKYVDRHRRKNGKQDLLKAKDYIEKLIELEYPETK